jgi:flagellar basal-body rod protein FlgB
MGINFNKDLKLHSDALQVRAERTKILASNIANENTPGYQARDVDFAASMARAGAADPVSSLLQGAEVLYRVPNHPSADGNTVELGAEQAAFSQNASDFQASLTFLNIKIKGLARAIEGR